VIGTAIKELIVRNDGSSNYIHTNYIA